MTALQVIEDLLEKCQETYISHLARLGVISHVADLAGPLQEMEAVQEEPEVKGNEEETEKKVHVWHITFLNSLTVHHCITLQTWK